MLEKYTLKEVLNQSTEKFASNLALASVDGIGVKYKELKDKVNSLSSFLKEQGIIHGDKVAILSENSVNWGIAYFAITTIGAVAVPVLPDFRDNEVHHILRHSGCKVIFISQKQFPKIEELESDQVKHLILIYDFSIIPPETTIAKLKSTISKTTRPL